MGDHQNALACLVQVGQQAQYFVGVAPVQSTGGFVREQQLGLGTKIEMNEVLSIDVVPPEIKGNTGNGGDD